MLASCPAKIVQVTSATEYKKQPHSAKVASTQLSRSGCSMSSDVALLKH